MANLVTLHTNAVHEILKDDLYKTLKSNPDTKEFLFLRIKEIFEELYNTNQKEEIDRLSLLYA